MSSSNNQNPTNPESELKAEVVPPVAPPPTPNGPSSVSDIAEAEMEIIEEVLDSTELEDFDDLASLDVEEVSADLSADLEMSQDDEEPDAEADAEAEAPSKPTNPKRNRDGSDILDTLEMPVFKMPARSSRRAKDEPEVEGEVEENEVYDDGLNRAIPLSGILRGRRKIRVRPKSSERSQAPEPELPYHRILPDIVSQTPLTLAMAWANGPPPDSIPSRPLSPITPSKVEDAPKNGRARHAAMASNNMGTQAAPTPEAAAPQTNTPSVTPITPGVTPTAPAVTPPTPALTTAPVQPKMTASEHATPSHAPPQMMVPLVQTPPQALDPANLFSTAVPGGDRAFTIVRRAVEKKKSENELSGLVAELLGEEEAEEEIEESPPTPWWDLIFTEEFFRTIPMGFHKQTQREARFIIDSLGVGEGATILDLCCGFGRHTMELAKRGYDMAGLDLSLPLLQKALREAQRRSLSIKFIHGDVRELNFHEIFDAIFSFQTSFGYFDDRTSYNVLRGVYSALKPGGRFLLDVLNRDYIVGRTPLRVWWEGQECLFLEEVEFDFTTSVLHNKRSYIYDDGRPPWEQNIYVRLYSVQELKRMCELAGLNIVNVSGSIATRGHFLGAASPQVLLLVEKPR